MGISASTAKSVYTAARQAKGQGEGTDLGLSVSNFGAYQELLVAGFDFYNECNLDYYMVAIGSNVQNPSGLANLGVALYYRYTDEEDTSLTDLATATTAFILSASDANALNLGKATGTFARLVLQVEIPTTTDTE